MKNKFSDLVTLDDYRLTQLFEIYNLVYYIL